VTAFFTVLLKNALVQASPAKKVTMTAYIIKVSKKVDLHSNVVEWLQTFASCVVR
jgi:hypothetical protein